MPTEKIYAIQTEPLIISTLLRTQKTRINHQIQASELRVIDDQGNNLGVIPLREALIKAEAAGLDLIEISPEATPPVAKIMDYGKFQYAENKKQKIAKARTHSVETKSVQITIGTGEHDLALKAKQASKWLEGGNRIKIDLFPRGRAKYMDQKFLKERLERILPLMTVECKVVAGPEKSPKGLTIMVERVGKK